ncbi:MAG: hypothetical protein AAF086_01340 [Planctomycetota bacterium]
MRKRWWTPFAIYIPLGAFALVTLVPFAYLIFSAFKTKETFFSGPFWPVEDGGAWWAVDWAGFTIGNFTRLWTDVKIGEASFLRAVLNSFFFASVMSAVGTLGARRWAATAWRCSSSEAGSLSRRSCWGLW